jgi:hypothetical protein
MYLGEFFIFSQPFCSTVDNQLLGDEQFILIMKSILQADLGKFAV